MILILHLSDLHFADQPHWIRSLSGGHHQSQPNPWPTMAGHDERVADDLTRFWEKLKRRYPDLKIAITGDLTRSGGGLDFGCCHRYVHASWNTKFPLCLHTGLKSNCETVYTIPGNYDFWNLIPTCSIAYRPIIESHFWELPWTAEISENRMEVHLIGIDSCSGLFDLGLGNVIGLGAINSKQLSEGANLLKKALKTAKKRNINLVVRVALIHHSIKSIEPNSQRELLDWLKDLNINCLMTGHEHFPNLPVSQQLPPYELQCGTTLQAGTQTKLPGKGPNHFYLHSIERAKDNGLEYYWKTLEWQHNGVDWVENPKNPVWQEAILGIQP